MANEIQDLIDALPAGGGKVTLEPRLYEIDSPITITKNYVMLEGSGHATIIKHKAGVAHEVIKVGDGVTPVYNLILSDFRIDGNRGNVTGMEQPVIRLNMSRWSSIQRLYISSGSSTAIRSQNSQRLNASNNHISNCPTGDGVGFYSGTIFSVATGNVIHGCDVGVGVDSVTGGEILSQFNILTGNILTNCDRGIESYGGKNNKLGGNVINNCQVALKEWGTATYPSIDNDTGGNLIT